RIALRVHAAAVALCSTRVGTRILAGTTGAHLILTTGGPTGAAIEPIPKKISADTIAIKVAARAAKRLVRLASPAAQRARQRKRGRHQKPQLPKSLRS